MAERKPNNLPWILLGVLCGLVFLGLFGFGMYAGAKAVSDEITVTIPPAPDQSDLKSMTSKLTVFVSADNEITFEGKSYEDVSALEAELRTHNEDDLKATVFILKLNEDSSHSILVSMKDMFDALKLKSLIVIDRQNTE